MKDASVSSSLPVILQSKRHTTPPIPHYVKEKNDISFELAT